MPLSPLKSTLQQLKTAVLDFFRGVKKIEKEREEIIKEAVDEAVQKRIQQIRDKTTKM